MGCDDVKRVLYFFLDGSLGERKLKELVSHFDLCPECETRKRIQERLRNFVRERVERLPATDRFKTRLARSLRAVRSEA